MPSEPSLIALQGHQFYAWLKNEQSAKPEIYLDRMQNVEPTTTLRRTKAYELGRKGPVGSSADPPDVRVVWEENWVKWEQGLYQAGKDPTSDTTFNLGDLLDNTDVIVYLAAADTEGVVTHEYIFDQSAISEMMMTWRMGGPITCRWTREAINGRIYRAGALTHSARGTLDDASDGSINPKDARIFFFSSGCTPAASDRVYRAQGFDITARWPQLPVTEIGRRDKVGTLSDPPDVTATIDVQPGDDQPFDRFFTDTGTYIDLMQDLSKDGLVRIYDPDAAEAGTVLGAIHLENLKPSGGTPIRAQVRALATSRISLEVEKEVTTDSGGVICYVGDLP